MNADSIPDTGTGVVGTNMFAYCNNSPIGFIDPEGTVAVALPLSVSVIVVASYAILVTGLVYAALTAAGINISFSEVLSEAINRFAQEKRMKISLLKYAVQSMVAKIVLDKAIEKTKDICSSYKVGECDKAARAAKKYLKKHKINASVVILRFNKLTTAGIVYSISKKITIGTNYYHVGIKIENLVYCVVYPNGVTYEYWYRDFIDERCNHGTITEIPIDLWDGSI